MENVLLYWDEVGKRIGETGVDQGVLYPFTSGAYDDGVAWNGLTSVSESPTGAEANASYADNKKYIELYSEEEFAGSVGCFTYPDELKPCIGEVDAHPGVVLSQQTRSMCGLSYRTKVVNDTSGLEYGYKIHLVYGVRFGIASREHTSINESPDLEEFNFDFTATKVDTGHGNPTAHIVIDTTKLSPDALRTQLPLFLKAIYGDATEESTSAPYLPGPDEVVEMFSLE